MGRAIQGEGQRLSGPTPQLLSENPHLNKIPQGTPIHYLARRVFTGNRSYLLQQEPAAGSKAGDSEYTAFFPKPLKMLSDFDGMLSKMVYMLPYFGT